VSVHLLRITVCRPHYSRRRRLGSAPCSRGHTLTHCLLSSPHTGACIHYCFSATRPPVPCRPACSSARRQAATLVYTTTGWCDVNDRRGKQRMHAIISPSPVQLIVRMHLQLGYDHSTMKYTVVDNFALRRLRNMQNHTKGLRASRNYLQITFSTQCARTQTIIICVHVKQLSHSVAHTGSVHRVLRSRRNGDTV
jgi:hypothetical protein